MLKVFENLRDGNINPQEVLKTQVNFKLDLSKIKTENPYFKSEDQKSIIKKIFYCFFFNLREKII